MNILLADCSALEVESLAENLQFNNKNFQILSYISNWKRTGKLSELKRYAKYFFVGFKTFLKRKNYDAIVGWQQFYALIFCFFSSIFKVRKKNFVVALNFTYKEKNGRFSKLYRWFMSKCLDQKYLDFIHVPSNQYAKKISTDFNFPLDKIIVIPFGVNDNEIGVDISIPDGFSKEGFALAIGRSNRDYGFLCRAWKNINYPLVIISDTYKYNDDNPNITFLNNVDEASSYKWIANCALLILPIDDGNICSGDTVLLRAMSFSRKVLVTYPSTLAEMYIKHEENGLISHKNIDSFNDLVHEAVFSEKYENLGSNARACFIENYSRSSMGTKITKIINQKGM